MDFHQFWMQVVNKKQTASTWMLLMNHTLKHYRCERKQKLRNLRYLRK